MAFYELAGSPSEAWDESGFTAVMKEHGPWGDRVTRAAYWLATLRNYPRSVCAGAYARSVAVEQFPGEGIGNNGLMVYDEAMLTITFKTAGAEDNSGSAISESLEPNAEFLTLDPKNFFWDAAKTLPLKEGEAPGRLQRGFDYILTKYNQSSIPASCLTLPGSCNSGSVTSYLLGLTFTAETLLYQPPSLQRTIDTSGSGKWTIAHRLSFRPSGWNKIWRSNGSGWSSIYDASGTLYKNYPAASFSGIM